MPTNEMDDAQPLVVKQHVYKRRWWITSVFAVAGAVQSLIWNTWGPIAESSEVALDWSDGVVASTTLASNLAYIAFALPVCSFVDARGLKLAMRMCTILLLIGAGLRCFSIDPSIATPMAFICNCLQGIAGVIPFSGPALVSAIWYPPEERPTATALMSFFNYFGSAISFIIGPQLVPGPRYNDKTENMDKFGNATMMPDTISNGSSGTISNMAEMRAGILNLMYTHFALTILACLLVFVYFPDRPPLPPSKSASIERTNYKKAFSQMFRNGPLWLIMIAGSIPIGVVGVWIIMLDVLVKPIGVSQIDAGWMGFIHSLVGTFSGIFIAKFSDFFNRRRKIFLTLLFICGAISTAWFALLSSYIAGFSLVSMYAACILIGIFLNGPSPLFYELCAEVSYPVSEGVTGGMYTVVHSVFGLTFLALVSVPGPDTSWLTWVLLACTLIAIPMLLAFPEQYKRTDVDMEIEREVEGVVKSKDTDQYSAVETQAIGVRK